MERKEEEKSGPHPPSTHEHNALLSNNSMPKAEQDPTTTSIESAVEAAKAQVDTNNEDHAIEGRMSQDSSDDKSKMSPPDNGMSQFKPTEVASTSGLEVGPELKDKIDARTSTTTTERTAPVSRQNLPSAMKLEQLLSPLGNALVERITRKILANPSIPLREFRDSGADAPVWESPSGKKIDEDKLLNDYEMSKQDFAKNEQLVLNYLASQSQRIAELETLCENMKLEDVQSQRGLAEFERFKAFNAECQTLGSYADFKQVETLQDQKDLADQLLGVYDSYRKTAEAKASKSEADVLLWKNENTALRAENTALRAENTALREEKTVLRAETTQQARQEQSGSWRGSGWGGGQNGS
ncbi:hypothetical protein EG329_011931 [Mollisiaceae sp. DMI_Dod_QoI]|nr:hypothetical protein EG329_011931 [Helotiales sp. DMI_Dod_QoI]